MSYRPITDDWILARPKLLGGKKYYGAFPAGFLRRARDILGCGLNDPMLHVCCGHARFYPYKGFGEKDKTIDLNPDVDPDYLMDARDPWPRLAGDGWRAILADPPYSREDAKKYPCGDKAYPEPADILKRAVEVLKFDRKVGILHYHWVKPVKGLRSVAVITIYVGFGNKPRTLSVFSKE